MNTIGNLNYFYKINRKLRFVGYSILVPYGFLLKRGLLDFSKMKDLSKTIPKNKYVQEPPEYLNTSSECIIFKDLKQKSASLKKLIIYMLLSDVAMTTCEKHLAIDLMYKIKTEYGQKKFRLMDIQVASELIMNGIKITFAYRTKYVFNIINDILDDQINKVKYPDMFTRLKYATDNAMKLYLFDDDYRRNIKDESEIIQFVPIFTEIHLGNAEEMKYINVDKFEKLICCDDENVKILEDTELNFHRENGNFMEIVYDLIKKNAKDVGSMRNKFSHYFRNIKKSSYSPAVYT